MTNQELWDNRPAGTWTEAYPLGNGTMGAMVWGGIDEEVVSLNEGTLWSGYPDRWFNDGARDALAECRALMREGRLREAQAVVETRMCGRWTQASLPLGRLRVTRSPGLAPTPYRRTLDLTTATASATGGDGDWEREAFVSNPGQVLVYRFRSRAPGDWLIALESDLRGSTRIETDGLSWSGTAPRFVAPSYLGPAEPEYGDTPETSGMRYTLRLRVETDGSVEFRSGGTLVRGGRELVVVLAAATSFAGRARHPFTDGADEADRVGRILEQTRGRSFDALRAEHLADHRSLYLRAGLELPGAPEPPLRPTRERLWKHAGGEPDPGLAALAFHYGRYLLIASSRPGGQPAPLQGLWNQDVQAPWSGNYTVNINTQMNYWPAEVANLAECHQPFLDFIADASTFGREVASRHYGARGWTAHHNLDLWVHPIPAGDNGGWFSGSACHLFWPLGGAWLSHHLWEHWEFGRDRGFLEKMAWPVLREAARFGLDWLCDGPDGSLTTLPSTSPENRYLDAGGNARSIDAGTASDRAALRELFTQAWEASRLVGADPTFEAELTAALGRLPGFRTTASGALAEWSQDFSEAEPGHRHFSHLYGLFPGTQITAGSPEARAAALALEERLAGGGGGTGWSLAWLICLQARLNDGAGAEASLRRWLSTSVFTNLFDLHPTQEGEPGVFQIDGNFGVAAGIAELLVQSRDGVVDLLPALPPGWPDGRVWGLRVRGGGEVSVEWSAGELTRAEFRSDSPGDWTLRCGRSCVTIRTEPGKLLKFGPGSPSDLGFRIHSEWISSPISVTREPRIEIRGD